MRCEPGPCLPIARISTWSAEQKNTESQFIWDLTGCAEERSSCLTSVQWCHILHMSSMSLPKSLGLIGTSLYSHQQLMWEVVRAGTSTITTIPQLYFTGKGGSPSMFSNMAGFLVHQKSCLIQGKTLSHYLRSPPFTPLPMGRWELCTFKQYLVTC